MKVEDFINACGRDGQKIERLIRSFYSRLEKRDVLIDGGAHHGYHTSYARRFYDLVISVEASPRTYVQHVRRQIKVGKAEGANGGAVIPINGALGSRTQQGETISFFYSETHPGRSTVNTKLWDTWARGDVVYQEPIAAPVIEIDDLKALFAHGRTVNFVKLDLEGGEIPALRGAAQVLTRDRPAIVMEFGLKPQNEALYGETCGDFIALMRDFGYAVHAPWGEAAEDLVMSGYPFWYLFAFSKSEGYDRQVGLLKTAYRESMMEPSPE